MGVGLGVLLGLLANVGERVISSVRCALAMGDRILHRRDSSGRIHAGLSRSGLGRSNRIADGATLGRLFLRDDDEVNVLDDPANRIALHIAWLCGDEGTCVVNGEHDTARAEREAQLMGGQRDVNEFSAAAVDDSWDLAGATQLACSTLAEF